jgi:hypothetical protein
MSHKIIFDKIRLKGTAVLPGGVVPLKVRKIIIKGKGDTVTCKAPDHMDLYLQFMDKSLFGEWFLKVLKNTTKTLTVQDGAQWGPHHYSIFCIDTNSGIHGYAEGGSPPTIIIQY